MKQQVEWSDCVAVSTSIAGVPRGSPCLSTHGTSAPSNGGKSSRVTSGLWSPHDVKKQVVPLSGISSAPLIVPVKSLTSRCEIPTVDESPWESNWRKGVSLRVKPVNVRDFLLQREKPEIVFDCAWKTPGAACVWSVRPGFYSRAFLERTETSMGLCMLKNNIGLKNIYSRVFSLTGLETLL